MAILLIAGAPRTVVALAAAMAAVLFAVKGSQQVAVLAGIVVGAAVAHWILGLSAAVFLALMGWASVRVGRHTLGRVVMSAIVGPAAGVAVFLLAR